MLCVPSRVSDATRTVSDSALRASEDARGTTNAVRDVKAVADAVERTVVKIVEVASPQLQALVAELKAGVALLQEKLEAAQEKAKTTERTNTELMENIVKLDVEVSSLRERAGARQQALDNLTSNNQTLRDNNAALNASVEALSAKLAVEEDRRVFWLKVAAWSMGFNILVIIAGGFYAYRKVAVPWLG